MSYWAISVWLLIGYSVGVIGREKLAYYVGPTTLGVKKDIILCVISAFLSGYIVSILGASGFFGFIFSLIVAFLAAAAALKYNYKLAR